MVSGCCKCQICAERSINSILGYILTNFDGILGEAESLANFEELLESYPYCHLYVIIPLVPTTHGILSMDYKLHIDREQTNKRQYLDYYNLPLQLRDHFFGCFLKLKRIFETTRWQCNHMSDCSKVPELGF